MYYLLSMNLGEKIKSVRKANKFSLRDLAARFGMNYSYLGYIEAGERYPGTSFAPQIAEFLGISVKELISSIYDEKAQQKSLNIKNTKFAISFEDIECLALNDRSIYLENVGRDRLIFPKDRNSIPQVLCDLQVVYDDILFGVDDSKIYAGLFPQGHFYQGETNVIAVATRPVQKVRSVSESTKTFQVLHEVGHYRIHWHNDILKKNLQFATDRPLYCSSGDDSIFELQSNLYASSFLMPADEVKSLMGGRTVFYISTEAKKWCEHFSVEINMLSYRLKHLHIQVRN
jgi:transcriptional regulator with XRE-family HTH domain